MSASRLPWMTLSLLLAAAGPAAAAPWVFAVPGTDLYVVRNGTEEQNGIWRETNGCPGLQMANATCFGTQPPTTVPADTFVVALEDGEGTHAVPPTEPMYYVVVTETIAGYKIEIYEESNGCPGLQKTAGNCDGDLAPEPADKRIYVFPR